MAPFNLRHSTVLTKASNSQQLKHQNAKEMKKMKSSMRQLRAEMREISEDQKNIRDGQKQVRKIFESIESECQKLRQETKLITQQSAISRDRLTLMFQILKARQNNDFPTATALTQALRKIKKRLSNISSDMQNKEEEGIKLDSTQKWTCALP